MSHACTLILVRVVSPVLEIWLLFPCLQKRPKFPFGPWSSKNLIHRNRPKKFMQIGIDVTCMHTNFGWCVLSGFGVMASFCLPSKTAKISLRTMDYSPWSSKNLIDWNRLKKFMQIGIDVKSKHTNFGGRGLSGFGVMAFFCLPSKMAKISLWTMDYSPWSSKNLIDRNWLKNFMQIGIDVTCKHINFGGRGLSGFGVMASFCLPSKTAKISYWTMGYSPWS